MTVTAGGEDEIIPVVADSQRSIASVMFAMEHATKICRNGLLFKQRQGIIVLQ